MLRLPGIRQIFKPDYLADAAVPSMLYYRTGIELAASARREPMVAQTRLRLAGIRKRSQALAIGTRRNRYCPKWESNVHDGDH